MDLKKNGSERPLLELPLLQCAEIWSHLSWSAHHSFQHMWLKSKSGKSGASLVHLGELESALMEFMWRRSEVTVAEAQAEFAPNLAYTTVMTTLCRLWRKGLLNRRKVHKSYVYVAALTEREYQDQLTHHLLEMALNEGRNTGAVLSHFVDVVGVDKEMLERLEQLIKDKRRTLRLAANTKPQT